MTCIISCIVEGHGEVSSVPVLLRRIAAQHDPTAIVHVLAPLRVPPTSSGDRGSWSGTWSSPPAESAPTAVSWSFWMPMTQITARLGWGRSSWRDASPSAATFRSRWSSPSGSSRRGSSPPRRHWRGGEDWLPISGRPTNRRRFEAPRSGCGVAWLWVPPPRPPRTSLRRPPFSTSNVARAASPSFDKCHREGPAFSGVGANPIVRSPIPGAGRWRRRGGPATRSSHRPHWVRRPPLSRALALRRPGRRPGRRPRWRRAARRPRPTG